MADATHIEWTDATWNPVTGCSVVSPGCTNCYAMKLAGTRLKHHPSRVGLTVDTKAGPVWNGQVRFNAEWLDQPLRWARPRRIFVCAHGDLFHEDVPDAWIDRVFAVMALAPQHTFQVLTKRAARMRAYLASPGQGATVQRIQGYALDYLRHGRFQLNGFGPHYPKDYLALRERLHPMPLPNVWLGVSAEDQSRADERIPDLLATPAAVRFVSLEPLLGPIDLAAVQGRYGDAMTINALKGTAIGWPGSSGFGGKAFMGGRTRLDLVIVGGENGPRPTHPDWVRLLRDQCEATETAFFFKQWGSWLPADQTLHVGEATRALMRGMGNALRSGRAKLLEGQWTWQVGKKAAGRLLDGVEHNAMPEVRR